MQEAVELADGGELAGRRELRARPWASSAREMGADVVGARRPSGRPTSSRIGFEVAAVGGERVVRGAALGRHHFEEALDQRGARRQAGFTWHAASRSDSGFTISVCSGGKCASAQTPP